MNSRHNECRTFLMKNTSSHGWLRVCGCCCWEATDTRCQYIWFNNCLWWIEGGRKGVNSDEVTSLCSWKIEFPAIKSPGRRWRLQITNRSWNDHTNKCPLHVPRISVNSDDFKSRIRIRLFFVEGGRGCARQRRHHNHWNASLCPSNAAVVLLPILHAALLSDRPTTSQTHSARGNNNNNGHSSFGLLVPTCTKQCVVVCSYII